MISKKHFLSSLAIGISAVAVLSANAEAKSGEMEKCYGIVKAGQNDCSDSQGKHSCAGGSTKDSSKSDWVLLPKGTCQKIVGGSLK